MRNACILLIDHDPGETGFVRTSLNKAGILNELVVVDYYKGEFYPPLTEAINARPDLHSTPAVVLLGLKITIPEKVAILKRLREERETGLCQVVILASSEVEQETLRRALPGANTSVIEIDDPDYINVLRQQLSFGLMGNETFGAAQYLELANVMLLILDVEGKVMMLNRKGCEVLGYGWGEIIGQKWVDVFIPAQIKEIVASVFQRLISGESGIDENYVNPVVTKSGEEKIIEWHNTVLRDKFGKVFAVLSSGNEITERIKIERALQDSEEKYRNLIENLPVGIAIATLDGRSVTRNKAAQEMHGYTSKEEYDRVPAPNLYFDPEDRKRFLESLSRGIVRNFEVRHRRKDGSVFWISLTAIPQIDENGEKQLVTVGQDITERKQAEEALRASEEKFRSLLENAPVGITVITPDGRRLEANNTIVEMHRYGSKEEYLNAPVQDIYYNPDERKHFMALLEKGSVQNYELRRKRKDGSVFWASLTSIPYVNSAGEKQLINVVEDITERKQAEEALRASEEKYRNLVANAPIGITISAPDGHSVERNAAAQQMHGYESREEFMKVLTAELYYDAADRKRFLELAARGPVRDFEVRHKRKDGSPFWVSQTSIPIATEKGEPQFIVIIRDITERKEAEEALKTSEEKFRNLVENAPVGISITTPDGRRLEANSALITMHGYDSKEEFLKVPSAERYYDPKERNRLLSLVEKSPVRNFEVKLKKKDGSLFWGSVTMMPQVTASGEKQFIVVTQDITERKQSEEALKLSEEKFRNIFDFSGDAVFIHTVSGGYIEVNRTASETFGFSREELLQMTPANTESAEFAAMASERMRELIDRGQVSFETVYIAKDKRTIPVEIRSTLINYNGKPAVLNAVRDISERKKMEEAVRQLAYHDSLTGLPNRVLFNDRMGIALARARRYRQKLALSVIDLDHFKNINDSMGHEAGDELLKEVGNRLISILRKSDTVARFGGDEFILLFTDVANDEGTITLGRRIIDVFQKPFSIAGREIDIKASIGLALFPDHGEDIDTLIKHADDAMYLVKVRGRNNYTLYTAGISNQTGKR